MNLLLNCKICEYLKIFEQKNDLMFEVLKLTTYNVIHPTVNHNL